MQKILTLLFFICCAWLTSCKKDEVAVTNIHGSVFNLCTNQNMANIAVTLICQGPNAPSNRIIHSDVNGNFTFNNANVNMSNDYSYKLYIESKSGFSNNPADVGFDGVSVTVDKSNLSHIFKLGVVPHFKTWAFYFPSYANISASDTVQLTIEQKAVKANIPQNPNYKLTLLNSPTYPAAISNGFIGHIGNYWMGWWHTTLDRTTNGVHIVKTDSFYIDWGEIRSDTITY